MSIKHQILNSLSDILELDYSGTNDNKFYSDLLSNLREELDYTFSFVYFLDDVSLSKKAQYCSKSVKNSFFEDNLDIFDSNKNVQLLKFLNSNNKKTFCVSDNKIKEYLNTEVNLSGYFFLVSKLLVKNSFFGFVVLLKDGNFSSDEIAIVNLYLSIYSYLIKDYELNNVFKMQLSLLQDAITDKENAYKIIEKQNKKLIQSDNVKTSFLANVSHELRTPLNAIIGFSDVLLGEVFGKLNDKQAEYIKDINLSSVHLLGLINSLLDFSKIESGAVKLNLSEFEPKRAIGEVINLLTPLLSAKEIKLIYESGEKSSICADYQKFQQILFNLIGNAIKFSPQKGKILVRTYNDGEYFILEVEDFGIGIEKKYHNFIFKKFTQIDNIYTKTGTSTGLGLAIVKEYAKLHKGKIHVVSKPGQGSTFVVRLRNRL